MRIRKPLYALAPVVVAAALRKAHAVLAEGGFDVIHVHWVVPNGPIGARASSRHDLPLVVSLHGSDIAVSERSRAIGRATRWSLGRCAAVTAPSGDLLERARRLGASRLLERVPYGADAEAFEVPPGTADALRQRLGLGSGSIVVAGVGRLIPVKGFEYLVEAHAAAVAAMPELRLVLVGDGDGRQELEERVRLLGVSDTVVLTGAVAPSQIPAHLAAADIVSVPSVRHGGFVDGLPNVAFEAMAAGKPVVGSRVGGIPELVRDGENGLLVPEKDSAALANALVVLARDPALRARLGASGREEIRTERSWDAVGRRFVEIYERIAPA
jgi:glycosyltransferase involved in cell wall biosynthesis